MGISAIQSIVFVFVSKAVGTIYKIKKQECIFLDSFVINEMGVAIWKFHSFSSTGFSARGNPIG